MKSQSDFQLIKDAYKSIERRRYRESIVILEKIAASGRDPYPYFLLAVACLFADRLNRVEEILGRIKSIDPNYPPYVELQGFLNFKSAPDFETALGIYVDLANRYPSDPILAKCLKLVRDSGDFSVLQKSARLHRFVMIPKPPKHLKRNFVSLKSPLGTGRPGKKAASGPTFFTSRTFWIALAVLIVSISAGIFLSGIFRNFFPGKGPARSLDSIDRVSITGTDFDLVRKIGTGKEPEFYGSASELSDDFNKAKAQIKSGKHNEALYLLNRIANSNASFPVREKAEFLIKFVNDLEYRDFETISFEKLSKKPYLYRGFSLKMKGRVANLREKNEKQFFSLLIDYLNGNFSGVADVYSERSVTDLANGKTIELDSIFVNSLGNNRMYLIAKKIKINM